MTLAEMIAKFKERTSGLGDDLSDAAITEYLDQYYQIVIPTEVDGPISEYLWEFTTSVGTRAIGIPDNIVSLNKPSVWLHDVGSDIPLDIDVYRDPRRFEQRYPGYPNLNPMGKPEAILIFRDEIHLNISSDKTYDMKVSCRGGPLTGLNSAGESRELYSRAIVAGAAWEYLTEMEDEEGAAREDFVYQRYLGRMRTKYKNYYEPRRPRRTF